MKVISKKSDVRKTVIELPSRMQYWDIAKGIAILLVILGHLPQTPTQITQAVYTFHMPFFFVANAFFIKHYDIKLHAKKSFKSLLVPYMTVCVLEAICYALRGNTDVYYTYDILHLNGDVISGTDMTFMEVFWDKIADMFAGISFTSSRFKMFESVWIVWFLAVLFVAKMMYVGLMKVISYGCGRYLGGRSSLSMDEQKRSYIVNATSLGIMLILAVFGMQIGQDFAFLPWSVDVAMACLPFMWIGDYLGKNRVLEHKNAKWIYGSCFVAWVVLSSMGYRGELALRIYPGGLVWMINAMLGSVVMIGVSKYLSRGKNIIADFFAWCGKNSIVILGIHCLEHRFFDWNAYLYQRLPIDLHWGVMYVIHVAAIVCSAWIVVECKRRARLKYVKPQAA